jgi:phage terminase large subunit-like protein
LLGALWTHDQIEELQRYAAPVLQRIVIAIDPSGTQEGDESGLTGAGIDQNGNGWALCDASGQYAPTDWARKAVEHYHQLRADRRRIARPHREPGFAELFFARMLADFSCRADFFAT